MGKRLDAVIRLREAAFNILAKEGYWKYWGGSGPYLAWENDNGIDTSYTISLNTPFQQREQEDKFYRLEIWCNHKVLNMSWDFKGEITLRNFRRGSWENLILS